MRRAAICRTRPAWLAAALVGLFLAGASGPSSAQARPVLVYGVIHEITLSNLMKMFYSSTGIRAEFVRMSAGEVAARVLAERGRPRADVILGVARSIQEDLKNRGVLEKYVSPTRTEIPAQFRDPDGYWTGTTAHVQAIVVHVERFRREFPGVPTPRTYEDLLDPRYRGHIIAASPVTSGSAFNFVLCQIFRLGEERAWEFLTALDRNVRFYTASGIAPATSVGAGEFVIGITQAHDALIALADGRPVTVIHPPKVGWDVGSVSLIKNSPNPEGAQRFIDWILTQRPLELITRINFEYPVRPDVAPPRGAALLKDLDLVAYDLKFAAENRERIIREWARRFQK
ncbi:MAG: ABC transporter substrate-binding protein [Armatimonadota bacterium]|nr:ABC transporter substrate-binding protein [Armatimonadota bacterium]MDR7550424.1 ABC transporter substrate-binding protein [Armatimonadota bacterium]